MGAGRIAAIVTGSLVALVAAGLLAGAVWIEDAKTDPGGYVVSDESHDLAWRGIAGLADDAGADASVRRMAGKWLARLREA